MIEIEKRDFMRMHIDTTINYKQKIDANNSGKGLVQDLSATGIAFLTSKPLALDAEYEISITPGVNTTPPFNAIVCIIRTDKNSENTDYPYAIAAKVVKLL